ncbi:MAG: ATP-binding protein [Acidobacteriota bacterium]|nr:ATP-binding protein [Acidobacteriota bacterium]
MNTERNSLPSKPKTAPKWLIRHFGGLKVRYKLVVLHNFFFFVLATAVYLSVIPIFAEHIENAMQRELHMMSQIFGAELPMSNGKQASELSIYDLRQGGAPALGLSAEGQLFLTQNPSATWQEGRHTLFRDGALPGTYRRVSLSSEFYEKALRQARISLFVVLGTIYTLSIIVMEFVIMPQYVYKPLQLMLEADEATLRDDRKNEMIDTQFILDDEIGQIMHSRNATVAQLRRQEDDLANALQRLEEQDRLVSLGLLSTSVAHELNTPLAVLQGSIEKLLETIHDSQTIERLQRMLRVTLRMRKISEGLVDFARVRKQETEAVLLRPLIDESWNLVAIDEKAAVVTFQNQVQEAHMVLGNPDRLVQVFVNLLRNALIAVPSGGAITAQSRPIRRGGQNYICCMVLDDGPGISAQVLPNLFEAFVTTRLDASGTGLGLTVAEGIVTQHGGTISASNRPEGGASLEVVLPAAA